MYRCATALAPVLLLLLLNTTTARHSDADLTGEDLAALAHSHIEGVRAVWFRATFYSEEADQEGNSVWNGWLIGEYAFRVGGDAMARVTSTVPNHDGSEMMRSTLHLLWSEGQEYLFNVDQKAGMIRSNPFPGQALPMMFSGLGLAGTPRLGGGVHELIEADGVSIERIDDDGMGRPRIQLHIPHSQPRVRAKGGYNEYFVTVTLDHDRGFAPVRIETHDLVYGFRHGIIEGDGHIGHNGVWIPTTVETDHRIPDFLFEDHPSHDKYKAALLKRGVDLDAQIAGAAPDPPLDDPARHRAIRESLKEVYPEGLPEGHSPGRSRLVVTEVLGVNAGVPDRLFEIPFPDGVEVYDARDMQIYIVKEGSLIRTPGDEDGE